MEEAAGLLTVAALRPLLEAGAGSIGHLSWRSGAGTVLTFRDDGSAGARLQLGEDGASGGTIGLKRTPQPFGGGRWWFHCIGCGRWRTALYLAEPLTLGGARPQCRACRGLAYTSQRLANLERLQQQRMRVADRIAGRRAEWGEWPERTKGMHRARYERELKRLQMLDDALDAHFIAGATRLLGRIRR